MHGASPLILWWCTGWWPLCSVWAAAKAITSIWLRGQRPTDGWCTTPVTPQRWQRCQWSCTPSICRALTAQLYRSDRWAWTSAKLSMSNMCMALGTCARICLSWRTGRALPTGCSSHKMLKLPGIFTLSLAARPWVPLWRMSQACVVL